MVASAALLAAAPAAACTLAGDPAATVRPVDPTVEGDARRIVSMSLLPGLMHIDRKSVSGKLACRVGDMAVGERRYTLWGTDGPNRQRRALPDRKGDPVAIVITVVDVMEVVEARKRHLPAPVDGYLLATVDGSGFTAWRLYTAMPDAGLLMRDMATVMGPAPGRPIFRRTTDNKVRLFVG